MEGWFAVRWSKRCASIASSGVGVDSYRSKRMFGGGAIFRTSCVMAAVAVDCFAKGVGKWRR